MKVVGLPQLHHSAHAEGCAVWWGWMSCCGGHIGRNKFNLKDIEGCAIAQGYGKNDIDLVVFKYNKKAYPSG